MTKRTPQRRKQQTRQTNWAVIGGLIAVGVLVFGALIYLALRQTENTPSVADLADYCTANPDRCAFSGDPEAPVTMVEVSDFGCVHCTNFHNNTAEALHSEFVEPGTLRWVALPYALNTTTLPAAAAAMCAGEQELYFEFANALFAIDPIETRLTPGSYQQVAEAIGADLDTFQSCLEDGRNISLVNQNRDAARDVQVTGTPTFFIDGQKLEGAQPLDVFAQTINSLLPQ